MLAEASGRYRAVGVDDADPAAVSVAVVWQHEPGSLQRYPNLSLVHSLGHGVEQILDDPGLPDVQVARLVDPGIPAAIARWTTRIVLSHTQREEEYREHQAAGRWRPMRRRYPESVRVGVLGLGEVGRAVAGMARGVMHPVAGWRATDEPVPGVHVLTGRDGLRDLFETSSVVINTLPSTPDTRHLVDRELLAALPDGAWFVNVGRGDVVSESVLLAALDDGLPALAHLDVFEEEPLPADSELWSHPNVRITPHVSGPTSTRTALPPLVENIHRVLDGLEPNHVVDRARGY